MSSLTSAPESITFLAARPSGVPALTAARSMSPVEICGMPKLLADERGLRSLAGAGGAQQDESHGVGLRVGCGRLDRNDRRRRALPASRAALRQNPQRAAAVDGARARARSSAVSTPIPGASSLTCTAMRSPCQSTRSCSSRSTSSSGLCASARKAAQEAGAVRVEADVTQRRARPCDERVGAGARRAATGSARARSRARGRRASSTTLTMFGLSKSRAVVDRDARPCSSRNRRARASSAAQASISAGSISGSSPWTLTTISSPPRPSASHASAMPVAAARRGRREVSSAATPCRGAGGDDLGVVRGDDDARRLRARGARATRTIIGSPPMSASALRGKPRRRQPRRDRGR